MSTKKIDSYQKPTGEAAGDASHRAVDPAEGQRRGAQAAEATGVPVAPASSPSPHLDLEALERLARAAEERRSSPWRLQAMTVVDRERRYITTQEHAELGRFLAAADPGVVLELVGQLRAARARVAELERQVPVIGCRHAQTIPTVGDDGLVRTDQVVCVTCGATLTTALTVEGRES